MAPFHTANFSPLLGCQASPDASAHRVGNRHTSLQSEHPYTATTLAEEESEEDFSATAIREPSGEKSRHCANFT